MARGSGNAGTSGRHSGPQGRGRFIAVRHHGAQARGPLRCERCLPLQCTDHAERWDSRREGITSELGVLPAARLRRAVPTRGRRSRAAVTTLHLRRSASAPFHHRRGCAGGPHHEGFSRWGPAQLAGGGRHAYRRPRRSGARLSDFAPVRPSGFLPRATRGRRRARARRAPCRKSRPRPQTSCLDFDTRAAPPASRSPPLQRPRARCAT